MTKSNEIMSLVCDYADAFHKRVSSMGEVDNATYKKLKHTQMAIAEKIRQALAQPAEQEPVYKMTVVDDQHPNGIPSEQWGNPPEKRSGFEYMEGFAAGFKAGTKL